MERRKDGRNERSFNLVEFVLYRTNVPIKRNISDAADGPCEGRASVGQKNTRCLRRGKMGAFGLYAEFAFGKGL